MNTINNKLKKLYSNLYPELTTNLNKQNTKLKEEEKATNPLLIQVNEKYANADMKIMFFGQETNFWLGERNSGIFLGEIEPVLNLYENFYLNGQCYSYGGQFWNGIKKLKNLLSEKIPNKEIAYIWNNVVKIGKCGKGFPKDFNFLTTEYFNVILQEIDILKPDILIFFSGHNYDSKLKRLIGDFSQTSINPYTNKQLCKINSSKLDFAIRTYHPNYLFRNNIDKYFSAIVDEIIKNFKLNPNV